MWESWVRSLGWEDPVEEAKTIHSRILTWRIPWTVWSMGPELDKTGLLSLGIRKTAFTHSSKQGSSCL